MKQVGRTLVLMSIMIYGQLCSHPEPFSGIFLKKHKEKIRSKSKKGSRRALGKKQPMKAKNAPPVTVPFKDNIFAINGFAAFRKVALEKAFDKPVVIEIFSEKSPNVKEVRSVYKKVATELESKVVFGEVDLFRQNGKTAENYNLVMQIMLRSGMKRIELPTYLFFYKGKMMLPMAHGFHSKDSLLEEIQKRFFNDDTAKKAGSGDSSEQERETESPQAKMS